jgi:hypothetical protein
MIARITHPDRVRDAREAAMVIRALGGTHVRLTQHNVRAWVVKDPPAIARVLAAVEPDTKSTVDFEGITREATAPLLAALVASQARVIFITGKDATLNLWPQRNEAFIDRVAVGRANIFERFRDACAVTWINASVDEPGAECITWLARVLAELDQPEIEVDLELGVDAALALALDFPDAELEWTGADIVIQLPAGELAVYRVAPLPVGYEAAWRARIAAALATARAENKKPD